MTAIPLSWRIGGVVVAILLAIGGYELWAHKQQQIGAANQRADDAGETIKTLQQSLADAKANADETQRRLNAQKESQDVATKQAAQARADADAATAAGQRMRKQLDAYTAAVRAAASNPAPGSVSKGEPGADPLDLLALLLSRTGEAAGDIGRYADQLRTAGAQCERDTDSLRLNSLATEEKLSQPVARKP